ncbi:exocrine gland-secreted peptide 1-like [Mus pahari]|uniref:exocrine gland-secreted peptide 1-like n=1 Tax=Mus pahari TaxID=10093 RepID=UPI000A30B50F|nr:exocrine gland-secreted peptide 1-like [Mus pahari]
MASFPLMYFLIILVFQTILSEGRALKRTEKEPDISADLKDDFKIPLCQILGNKLAVSWFLRGSDQDQVLFQGFLILFEPC